MLLIIAFIFVGKPYICSANVLLSTEGQATSAGLSIGQEVYNSSQYSDYFLESESDSGNADIYDPFEKINRPIFKFNMTMDRYAIEPVAKAYQFSIPEPARRSLGNFVNNLYLPVSMFHSVLQLNFKNFGNSMSRFIINSSVGIGGLFDVAGKIGIHSNNEDMGQSLGRYKVPSGPYLVIPFLGPSTLRDTIGNFGDFYISPVGTNAFELGGKRQIVDNKTLLTINLIKSIDKRVQLINVIDDVRRTAFDPYSTMKFMYIQNRNKNISE